MAINKHGLKMIGLKAASGATDDYGYYSGQYDEIFYDRATGKIWTIYQYSLGQNSWTRYDGDDVIKICNASQHMTMQEIADAIAESVEARREAEELARWAGAKYAEVC